MVAVEQSPISRVVTSDLERLKWTLSSLSGRDVPRDQIDALRVEVSAIRLHLKRLVFERERTLED